MIRAIAIFLLVGTTALVAAQVTIACDKTQNHGGAQGLIYNAACPPERPYCTGSSGLCSECAIGKDPLCDCPPNYKCAAAWFNTVRDADFCAPMPLTVIDGTCTDATQCNVDLTDQRSSQTTVAFYTSCVNSVCRYCNGRSYSSTIICKQGEVPGGGDQRVYGSKTNARLCLQSGNVWNSNTMDPIPPMPTDMYEYERNQYASVAPSTAAAVSPSLSTGASPSPTPSPSAASALQPVYGLFVGVVYLACLH